MALAANTALIHILEDSTKKTVVKLVYHAQSAADEADVLKVNVATLSNRTQILHIDTADPATLFFAPDELITANGGSGATGRVTDWNPVTGNLTVVLVGANNFTGTDAVIGSRQYTEEVDLDAAVTPTYLLSIESITWNVVGDGKVELEWGNSSPAYATAITLAGNGYYGRNLFGPPIPNNIASPNGNLYVSTHGTPAKGGYSMVIELRKDAGFSSRSNY